MAKEVKQTPPTPQGRPKEGFGQKPSEQKSNAPAMPNHPPMPQNPPSKKSS